ncbi:unnamed protein product [Soboliphyme baturini]|uniref:Ionotropic glutamate receptor C-terminal domain-containing protein n=1 Tax=Soboliphyme baturini TaxID=241478 RepID=A0A3P8DG93_9BILA|nr:unnamed protein product [Soboliphyme baturini]
MSFCLCIVTESRTLFEASNPPFVNYFNESTAYTTNTGSGPGLVVDILLETTFQDVLPALAPGCLGTFKQTTISCLCDCIQGEFDIFAEAFIARSDAHPGMDLSVPFLLSETAMLVRSPDYYVDNTLMMVTPFSFAIWAIIAAMIVVSGITWYGFTKVLTKVSEVPYNFVDSIWVFYSVFLQQGLPVLPRTWTCRSLLSLWWLVSLTLWATFTGNMLLMFSVHRSKYPFDTFEEMVLLLQDGMYKVLTLFVTNIAICFNSVLESYKQLWLEMSQNGRWLNASSLEKGRDMVIAHKNVILLGPRLNLEILAADDCRVTVISGNMMQVWYSLGFPENSPYALAISETLLPNDILNLLNYGQN